MSPPSSPSSTAEEKVESLGEPETREPCCETLPFGNDLVLQTRTDSLHKTRRHAEKENSSVEGANQEEGVRRSRGMREGNGV